MIGRTILIVLFSVNLFSCGGSGEEKDLPANDSLHGKISLSGAFALYPLAVKWTEEYKKLYPHVSFDVQAGGAGKGLTDALSGTVDIGMVSRDLSPEEIRKGALPIVVAKDAVVATISDKNPYLKDVQNRGITKEQFQQIWLTGSLTTWGQLLGTSSNEQIKVFTRSDAAGAPETWAKYLSGKHEDLKGIGVFGDPGVAESVMKDKLAIGYNNVNYVYDIGSKKPYPGLLAIPIDLNGNGTLDEDERFYDDMDSLNEAVIDGRYPSPPARDCYFVIRQDATGAALRRFLKWILTDGQQYVGPAGYVSLHEEYLNTALEKL